MPIISTMLRIVLTFLLLAAGVRAQGGDSEFLIRVWQSDEGLPGNVVRSIGQTDDGFLWVVTAEGLARFDGIRFETISSSGNGRNPELQLGLARVFTPDDGSVWVATLKGGLHEVRDGTITRVIGDRPAPDEGIITQVLTFGGSVHFVRDGRLHRLDAGGFHSVENHDADLAAAVSADARNEERRGRRAEERRPDRLIDRKGGRWRLRGGRLSYLSPDRGPAAEEIPVSEVGNRMTAHDLLEDREGNLWIASPVQGLIRVRHRRVVPLTTKQGVYQSAIKTAVRTRDGTWWIAPRIGGIDRMRNGEIEHVDILSRGFQRPVSCLFEDSRGRLWICSQDGSVYEGVESGAEVRFRGEGGLSQIKAMAEDSEGRLWFGGRRGLFRWDGESVENLGAAPPLAGTEVTTLAIDGNDVLYAGLNDGRVLAHDASGFEVLGEVGDERGKWITSIYPRSRDEIWVSTVGSGLFLRHGETWKRFGRESGIPDERLTALISDGGDALWFGSLGGIITTSRQDLLAWAQGNGGPPHWQRLDRSDGLMTRECAGGSQPAAFRSDNGTLWFPTTTGLAGVRPDRIEINDIPPEIHFDPVEINGVPQEVGEEVLLAGPGRTRLGFRFTGLSLSAPEKVSYRIRLLPIDEEFRYIGTQRYADYESVPPGRYTFEVLASNGDGTSTPRAASVSIRVRPNFWETGWFTTLTTITALLIALGVGWLDARRRSRKKIQALRVKSALEVERSRISRDLHDDIGASLTELSIRSALAAENPDDARLRPSLDQLALHAKHVVGALDEIVWATNPSKDSLRSLIEYLAFFARRFLGAVDIPLHTDIQREIPDIMIGPRRRHNLVLATREAINNAVKYASPTRISLKVSLIESELVVTVTDDGCGFDVDDAGTGNGLRNLRQRMSDCGGQCRIESVHGQGTVVTLILPLPEEPRPS